MIYELCYIIFIGSLYCLLISSNVNIAEDFYLISCSFFFIFLFSSLMKYSFVLLYKYEKLN